MLGQGLGHQRLAAVRACGRGRRRSRACAAVYAMERWCLQPAPHGARRLRRRLRHGALAALAVPHVRSRWFITGFGYNVPVPTFPGRIRRQRACPRPPAIRAAAQPAAALARARRRPLASLQRAPSATGSKAGFLFVALFVECLFFQGLPQTSSWRGHGTWSSPIIAITPLRQPSASDAVGQGVQEEQKGQGC